MNPYTFRQNAPVALIVSSDPLGGALIGAAVELAGAVIAYPRVGESPADALRRARPTHVLIDCGDAAVSDDSLLGPAMMTGAHLFVFGARAQVASWPGSSARFRFTVIALPDDLERIATLVAQLHEREATSS